MEGVPPQLMQLGAREREGEKENAQQPQHSSTPQHVYVCDQYDWQSLIRFLWFVQALQI